MLLKIDNIYTEIVGTFSDTDWRELEKRLSFRPEGYQFASGFNRWIYKDGKPCRRAWDGWKRQIWKNKTKTYFPTGLYSIVREFLKEKNIAYQAQDLRQKPSSSIQLSSDCEFRDYQQYTIDKACNIGRGLISIATGGGKTICAAGIIEKLKVSPFIFFVTSIDLLTQAKESFEAVLRQNGQPLKVGQIGAGVVDIQDINVMTIQTAVRALGQQWSKYKFDSEDTDDKTPIQQHKAEIQDLIRSAKGAAGDECISGDAIVITRNGPVRMDELHKYIGEEVVSFDGDVFEWKKITHFYQNGIKQTLKITLSNGVTIRCTDNHLIMTSQGWTDAGKIHPGDRVRSGLDTYVDNSANYVAVESISPGEEEPVFDITIEDTHCFFANGILVHNCQHWRADTCQLVTKEMKSCYYAYGLSATPERDSGDDMLIQACFGRKIVEISASELIQKGWLIKPNIKVVHVKNTKSIFKSWQTIYKEQVVENDFYNESIAKIANAYIASGRLALVLVQQIKHGETLRDMIPGSIFLSGNSTKKQRQDGLNKLRRREISCITSSAIFDEGIDCRPLDTVLLCGQGRSRTRAMQRVGRILRPYTDPDTGRKKETATAIDFCIHQKYLDKHSKAREKMYLSEPEFIVEHIHP